MLSFVWNIKQKIIYQEYESLSLYETQLNNKNK